jgi:hypothetical protein
LAFYCTGTKGCCYRSSLPYAAVPVVYWCARRDETEGRRMRPRVRDAAVTASRPGPSVSPSHVRVAPRQLARPSWPPGRSRLSPACGYAVDRSACGPPLRTNHRRDLDPSARAWESDPLCLRARATLPCPARANWRSDCRIAKRPHNHQACSRKAIDYDIFLYMKRGRKAPTWTLHVTLFFMAVRSYSATVGRRAKPASILRDAFR